MVTVGLLGFIVLGLTAMFVHTQKVFRAGITQSDVLEAGRAAMDLMVHDLEGTTPSRIPTVTNFLSRYEADSTNSLTGSTFPRTNVLSCFYFLNEYNHAWKGVGYVVAVPDAFIASYKVGTLYRFEFPPGGYSEVASLETNSLEFKTNALAAINRLVAPTNYGASPNISAYLTRVCDGVIHLRVKAYDTTGLAISPTNLPLNTLVVTNASQRNAFVEFPPFNATLGMEEYTCTNNAVPAYLDLELGILDVRAWERFKAIPNATAQQAYLTRQANAIHVFRRRVAVQNFDLEAYP